MAADIPVVITSAGAQPTPPATLLAQLIALVASTNSGYTASLPGSLIEDVSSTDVGALVICDTARVETINSLSPYSANAYLLSQLGQIYIGPGAAPAPPTNTSVYVVFTAIDPDRPATQSPVIIRDVIRREIGFGGLLMTDDLSMQALTGPFRNRAEAAFAAGVDIALHCNGDAGEMRAVCEGTPLLAGDAAKRADAAMARLVSLGDGLDLPEARARFAAAFAQAA